VVDLPLLESTTDERAIQAATRLVAAGAGAIKLEGGSSRASRISLITREGISVMGHVGLLPQTAEASPQGGYKRQGVSASGALAVIRDAAAVEAAGAFAVVLEMIPDETAAATTRVLRVPTIGIGAGPGCDGQVLVLHDMTGGLPGRTPLFSGQFAGVFWEMRKGLGRYSQAVRSRMFPGVSHSRPMRPRARAALAAAWEDGSV